MHETGETSGSQHLDEARKQQHGVHDQAYQLARPPRAQAQVGVQQHSQPEYEKRLLQCLQATQALVWRRLTASALSMISLQQNITNVVRTRP